MQLCSPHVQAVAAPAVNVAQSQAGTPTVEKTPSSTQSSPFDRNDTLRNVDICAVLSPEGIVPGQVYVVS